MRLTDISLDWLLPGAVLLVGVMAAVTVVARGKRAAGKAAADDSWERSEERRRRKEALYATASYVLLFCCAAVAAALSFHGLVGFGRQNLNLSGGWEYLVPFGLDGAAMFCSVLAVREASHGDAALGSRLLVWTFAGAAAWFNWVHAPRGMDHAGAPHFFAGMSLSAAVLFDRALKQTRRAALREQGLVPRPLPQIRIVRWLRAPRETFGAWSLMLLEGVRTLDEAVDEVREDRREREQDRLRRRDQEKLDRARIKALNRQNRVWGRGRLGHQVDVPALAPASGGTAPPVAEPAIAEPGQLPLRPRPSLQAVGPTQPADGSSSKSLGPSNPGSDARTVDLTAEDDTQALPRLDSLEQKLKDLEQQYTGS
ncbi:MULTISPECIES: DUF2637 domain-containing protein [Streptomyces]|uniref:DUF2637 domain-containing protein n=1 Tax=Streptomyces TaxID=1883 RepID=UPI0004C8182E|nr:MULTISPECIES: DUF2637 domain-containing protein [Streptomyces]NDZ63236.1 DUF2637 domain-containing protein [Streptomyces cyaneofuscatus]ONI53444.1 hypothetical protein STIB_27970 [Streptomyces sp. IB2014 011-1]RDV47832.1 DUF2637 domain-containing protein [Streptomyces sp. IB2014 011-12]CAD5928816.1 conserved membrane protein of unknown function [Streptomyces sp. KY70]CAD5989417.1 conserved membrane protein of unknown function [Streptomyces sp. KY75]